MYSVYRDIFVAFFPRWHLNPWRVCFPGLLLPSESNFPQSMHCASLACLCGLTNSPAPIVKYPLNWGWCANNGFRMANCFCCLSQNTMVCLAHCRQDIYNKSLEKLQDFFFKTKTRAKTKCSRPRPRLHHPRVQDQDQDFYFCPRGASRPRPWSRGLHHCIRVTFSLSRCWFQCFFLHMETYSY